MGNTFSIVSRQPIEGCFLDITKEISCDEVDYICFEERGKRKGGTRYFLSLKSKKNISVDGLANCISDWILREFEHALAKDIFNERFSIVFDKEADEIVKLALSGKCNCERLYDKKILVKNLTKYLNNNERISIDGFLRFRAKAYTHRIEEYLFDAAEEFFAEREYREFLELVKFYLLQTRSKIALLHIKLNCDGSFLLYDFKKSEVVLDRKDFDFYNGNSFGNEDLLSVLLTLNPKRIIWHNNCFVKDTNLIDTIKEIFEDRFTECNGCEFCIKI